jgi:hypothetical protein
VVRRRRLAVCPVSAGRDVCPSVPITINAVA